MQFQNYQHWFFKIDLSGSPPNSWFKSYQATNTIIVSEIYFNRLFKGSFTVPGGAGAERHDAEREGTGAGQGAESTGWARASRRRRGCHHHGSTLQAVSISPLATRLPLFGVLWSLQNADFTIYKISLTGGGQFKNPLSGGVPILWYRFHVQGQLSSNLITSFWRAGTVPGFRHNEVGVVVLLCEESTILNRF